MLKLQLKLQLIVPFSGAHNDKKVIRDISVTQSIRRSQLMRIFGKTWPPRLWPVTRRTLGSSKNGRSV